MKALCLVINGETKEEILEKIKIFMKEFPNMFEDNMITDDYEYDMFETSLDRLFTSHIINGLEDI